MKRKYLSLFIFSLISLPGLTMAYGSNDVLINEYMPLPLSGSSWVELRNTLDLPLDLTGWSFVVTSTSSSATTTLTSTIVPAEGLVYLDISLAPDGASLFLLDPTEQRIDAAAFGLVRPEGVNYLGLVPEIGQSAVSLGGPWMPTGSGDFVVSRGWFNFDPTKQSIIESLPIGVSSNLSTSTDEVNDWTNLGDIILSREGFDSVTWAGPHNLSGSVERTELLRLATELSNRVITPVIPPTPPSSSSGGGGGGSSYSPPILPTIEPATSTGLVLGAKTFRFTRFLRLGMRGTDVQELQKILKAAGIFKVQTTNYFGPVTKKSLILWQKKNKIRSATGVVGRPTLNYLNSLNF